MKIIFRAALLAGLAVLFDFVAVPKGSAQEITTFCGISGLSETAYSADNRDCSMGVYVRVDGEIKDGLDGRLAPVLSSISVPAPKIVGLRQPVIVELRSNGGNVLAAMDAGRVLRAHRTWTMIGHDRYAQSMCASACSLLFIAGANRRFEGMELDLHRPSLPAVELAGMSLADIEARNRELKQLLFAYAEEMNVDRRFIEISYSVPIDASVPLTVYQAREMHAAGMIDSEYDFRKGQIIHDLKLAGDVDGIFAYYLGREQVIRGCMEKAFRQAMGQGADPLDAEFAAFTMRDECWNRGFKAYPNQNDLKIPAEAHFVLMTFAEKS